MVAARKAPEMSSDSDKRMMSYLLQNEGAHLQRDGERERHKGRQKKGAWRPLHDGESSLILKPGSLVVCAHEPFLTGHQLTLFPIGYQLILAWEV